MMRFWMTGTLVLGLALPLAAQEKPKTKAGEAEILLWRHGGEPRRLSVVIGARPMLGVTVNMRGGDTDSIGAVIESVTPNSPADKAGLRSGDIITKFGGQSIAVARRDDEDDDDETLPGMRLIRLIGKHEPGDTVVVEYRRGKETRTTKVVFDKSFRSSVLRGPGDGFRFRFETPLTGRLDREKLLRTMPRLRLDGTADGAMFEWFGSLLSDVELAPLNADLGAYFGTSEGVLVLSVPAGSELGLKAGDVILSVDGRKPASPSHLLRILRSYEAGESVKFEIMRHKSRQTVIGKVAGRRSRDREE
ncbi:MAG: PDZ domain-containing protein [Gemmatimonadota bacterium]